MASGAAPAWVVLMPNDETAFAAPQAVLDLFQICVELALALFNVDVAAAGPPTADIAAEVERLPGMAFPVLVRADSAQVHAWGVDVARSLADMCMQQRAQAEQSLLTAATSVDDASVAPIPSGAAVPHLLASSTSKLQPVAAPAPAAATAVGREPSRRSPPAPHRDGGTAPDSSRRLQKNALTPASARQATAKGIQTRKKSVFD